MALRSRPYAYGGGQPSPGAFQRSSGGGGADAYRARAADPYGEAQPGAEASTERSRGSDSVEAPQTEGQTAAAAYRSRALGAIHKTGFVQTAAPDDWDEPVAQNAPQSTAQAYRARASGSVASSARSTPYGQSQPPSLGRVSVPKSSLPRSAPKAEPRRLDGPARLQTHACSTTSSWTKPDPADYQSKPGRYASTQSSPPVGRIIKESSEPEGWLFAPAKRARHEHSATSQGPSVVNRHGPEFGQEQSTKAQAAAYRARASHEPSRDSYTEPSRAPEAMPASARASAYRARALEGAARGPGFAAAPGPPMRPSSKAFSAPQGPSARVPWPSPVKGKGKAAKSQVDRTTYAQTASKAHAQPPHQKGGEMMTPTTKAGPPGPPHQKGRGKAARDSDRGPHNGASFDDLTLRAEAALNDLIPDDPGTRLKALSVVGSVARAMAVYARKPGHKQDCADTLEEVASAVLPFFDDDDVRLRLAGVQVIAGLGEFAEMFSEYLAQRAEDEDADVRTVALDAIRNLEQHLMES